MFRRPSLRCFGVPKLETFLLLVEEGWKGTLNKLQYACAWEAPITDLWAAESMQTPWNVSGDGMSHEFTVNYTWFILTTGDSSWSRSGSSSSDLGCSSCRILSNNRKSLVSDFSWQSSFACDQVVGIGPPERGGPRLVSWRSSSRSTPFCVRLLRTCSMRACNPSQDACHRS